MPAAHDLSVVALRVLVSVARHGTFTGAAEALSYTQSAVSRQIATLEADVGSPLFDRGARGVRLTEAGHRLLAHAQIILQRMETARSELCDLRELRTGRLRLGTFATANASLVPRAIAAFHTRHPNVQVSLVEAFSSQLLHRLDGGQIDLALITTLSGVPAPNDVNVEKIHEDRMFVALPSGHPCATQQLVRLVDLVDQDWIAGDARPEETLLAPLVPQGLRPRIAFVAKDWLAKQGLVAAGVGITLVPSLAIAAVRPDITLVALDPRDAPARTVYAATSANTAPSAAVKAFIALLHHERSMASGR